VVYHPNGVIQNIVTPNLINPEGVIHEGVVNNGNPLDEKIPNGGVIRSYYPKGIPPGHPNKTSVYGTQSPAPVQAAPAPQYHAPRVVHHPAPSYGNQYTGYPSAYAGRSYGYHHGLNRGPALLGHQGYPAYRHGAPLANSVSQRRLSPSRQTTSALVTPNNELMHQRPVGLRQSAHILPPQGGRMQHGLLRASGYNVSQSQLLNQP